MTETSERPGTPSAEIAVAVPGKAMDLGQVHYLAKGLALAGIMPDQLRGKPWDIVAMVLYGQDLGLTPMQSIQGIYVVKGKPQMSAQLWIALARRAGHRVSVLEHNVQTCTVEVIRGDTGEKHTETFTMQDAQRAKLATKDVWIQYPKRMLLARAVSDCCRFICPEIALGFYAEGDDFTDDLDAIVEVQPPAKAQQDIAEAEVVGEGEAESEVAQLAAEFNFAAPVAQPDEIVVEEPDLSDDLTCEDCGPLANHSEAACPKLGGA